MAKPTAVTVNLTGSATAPPSSGTPGSLVPWVRSPWAIFALCSLAAYLTTLDLSIINVAFPEIVREYRASRADVSWIVTIYNICFASLLVVSGKTADQLGRKTIFRAGLAVFVVGSVICWTSPNLGLLILGRAVQGIGGALITPASLGLLLAAFPLEKRTQTIAMWGGIGALGVASGPSLGAALITATDWRAAFWINVPVCAVLLIATGRLIPLQPRTPSAHRPDYLGASLITFSLGALALGISRSEVWGWSAPRTIGCLLFAVVLVPVFITRQRRHPEPVLDLSLFQSRAFTVSAFCALAFFAGFAALGLNNVLFLRQVWHFSVLKAGLLSALAPLTVACLAPFTGRYSAKIGFRPFLVVGSVALAIGAIAFATLLDGSPNPWLFVAIGECIACGIACVIPVNAAASVSELPQNRLSIGGAVTNTFRQVGSVLGIAILVAVIGTPKSPGQLLTGHHRGYVFIALVSAVAAVLGALQPERARA